MLCAVLIPSRARPDRLLKTIESVINSTKAKDVEILLRFDEDDTETLHRRYEFTEFGCGAIPTRFIVGPRGRGYPDLNKMYGELAAATTAKWLWMMNDDAVIVGNNWVEQLRELPTTGLLVQPEMYQLGHSRYANSEGGAFPIFPNGCWRPEWSDELVDPLDAKIDELLRGQRGWKTHFLPGIEVIHDRDDDAALEAHRTLPK